MSGPVVVSYGAGTNSTALLVGLRERGERPDAIVFADTGGERPETYALLDTMRAWLADAEFPELTTVRATRGGVVETLEANCLRTKHMPSIAYGYRACSLKWKRDPADAWLKAWAPAVEAWTRGDKVVKLIGFDADEPDRAERADRADASDARKRPQERRYPLIAWGWGRAECVDAIARAGLPPVAKSACFFCPMAKPREVLDLRDRHPDLLARAFAIEDAAVPFHGRIRGLGSYYNWREVVDADERQCRLALSPVPDDLPCDCFDGDGP